MAGRHEWVARAVSAMRLASIYRHVLRFARFPDIVLFAACVSHIEGGTRFSGVRVKRKPGTEKRAAKSACHDVSRLLLQHTWYVILTLVLKPI